MSLRLGIDAGHGGSDSGARGRLLGLEEKAVTLDIARRVAALGRAAGVSVVLTREADVFLTREERARRLGGAAVDLAVTVHVNGSASPARGYISSHVACLGDSAELAAICLQEALVEALGWPDGGVRPGGFLTLRTGAVPAVCCQVGFLSHPEQEAALARAGTRERAARGLLGGFLRWVALGEVPADVCGHRAEREIRRVWAAGWVDCPAVARFAPEQPVSRGELALSLARLADALRAGAGEAGQNG